MEGNPDTSLGFSGPGYDWNGAETASLGYQEGEIRLLHGIFMVPLFCHPLMMQRIHLCLGFNISLNCIPVFPAWPMDSSISRSDTARFILCGAGIKNHVLDGSISPSAVGHSPLGDAFPNPSDFELPMTDAQEMQQLMQCSAPSRVVRISPVLFLL